MSLLSTLYLIAVALCIFSTGFTTRARGKPLTFFTGFLLLQSAVFLFELLISHPSTPFKAVWLALLNALYCPAGEVLPYFARRLAFD